MRFLIRVFFPPRCILCRKILPGDEYGVCGPCLPKLPFASPERPFPLPFLADCFAPFAYEGGIARALHRLKFQSKPPYAVPLAKYMAACLPRESRFDLVTFVPVSAARKRERGFDQAEELARHVAAALYLPLVPTLVKTTENRRQSTLPAAGRAGNVVGVYTPAHPADLLPGPRLLLVDDIVTTGATLSEAAKTLRIAGASAVTGLAAAKTMRDRQKP